MTNLKALALAIITLGILAAPVLADGAIISASRSDCIGLGGKPISDTVCQLKD